MKHGYAEFGKVPVLDTFWVWVCVGYVRVCTYLFFFKQKSGTARCSSSTAKCSWIRLGYAAHVELCRFYFFYFFSFFFPYQSHNTYPLSSFLLSQKRALTCLLSSQITQDTPPATTAQPIHCQRRPSSQRCTPQSPIPAALLVPRPREKHATS